MSTFIGSAPDPVDHVVVLQGDVDTLVLLRLGALLDDALVARTRFLTIDAAAVTACDPELLPLLGRTQRRLARHRGLLTVRGMPSRLLAAVGAAGPARRTAAPTGRAAPDDERSGTSRGSR